MRWLAVARRRDAQAQRRLVAYKPHTVLAPASHQSVVRRIRILEPNHAVHVVAPLEGFDAAEATQQDLTRQRGTVFLQEHIGVDIDRVLPRLPTRLPPTSHCRLPF